MLRDTAAILNRDPIVDVGRVTVGVVAYLGGMAVLLASAVASLVHRRESDPPLVPALRRQLARLLAMGLLLVGLMHVGIGSFLSMQAFFGATFVEAIGPVV